MTEKNPTSWDIAAAAGVSQATVSRALRNSPLVRAETRERVQRIARELNYTVNRSAASLRTRQTNIIALLLFDELGERRFEANPLFLSMLGSITHAAADLGYDLLVTFQQESDDWHRDFTLANRVDGIILLGYGDYEKSRDKLNALAEADAPYILWGPNIPEQHGHSLGCDNVEGGYIATRHLLRAGRRRIAFLGRVSAGSPELAARYEGYRRALRESGLEEQDALCVRTGNDEAEAAEATSGLIAKGEAFDGLFAVTDTIAIGAMRALKQAGLAVPRQVAVVGFDDLPVAAYLSPSLTTVRQDVGEAGRLLVDNLVRMINDGQVESMLMQPRLIVRESA